ncbi:hypothetical protein V500_05907, partial [Pseudogymnoascus sp. VKM F-4518 (FW-2643)]
GGRPQLFIELSPEFTKGFLGLKDVNKFKIPEIIYDPTLAFKSPSIYSPEKLYSLNVLQGLNEQELPLKDEILNNFVFCQAVRKAEGVRIAYNLQLSSASVQYRMKIGGQITGFKQVTKLLEPQKALMRFACSMSWSIDPRRPWKLTPMESASINNLPCIVKWSQIVARLSGALEGSRREERYQKAQKRLRSERARQRRLLLLDIVDRYKKEQPIIDSERQLSGKVVDEDVQGALERSDHMTPEQLLLIDAVLTLPETTLEKESQRRIAAINAVTMYCGVEEGVTFRRGRPSRPIPPNFSTVKAENPLRSEADIMLGQAILSVTTDKRPTICFACLGNPNLTIRERVVSFSSPGCLTRHFMRKHVRRLGVNEPTDCRICDVQLEHRMHFQSHAERFHGTVSQVCD